MEDQKRGVESSEKSKLNPGRISYQPRVISIMIMRGVGKIHSFKISSWVVLLMLLFFISYFPVSIFIINAYFNLRGDNQAYIQKFDNLESELDRTHRDLRDSDKRLTLLKTLLEDMKRTDTEPSGPVAEAAKEVVDEPGPIDNDPIKENNNKVEEESSDVNVRDMTIDRSEAKISVVFKLVNVNPGADAVEGYIHLLIMTDGEEIPEEWIYPRRKFENGLPVDYKRGLPFYIRRFKPYKHKFQLESEQPTPTLVRILVHNKSGSIVLDKEFGIENNS